MLTHQAPRILVGARRPITSSCRTTLLLLIPFHLLGSLLDRDSRALGVAKVGAAEVRADLPLSDHAARGLCHLLLVAGLAQQGAGVVAKGGRKLAGPPDTSARIHLLHADAGRPGTGRPAQLDLAPKLLP